MAGAISQAVGLGGQGSGQAATASGGGLTERFNELKQLVGQQLTLPEEDKQAATAALDNLLAQLTSPAATIDDVKAARTALNDRFPWLEQPVATVLNSSAGVNVLGQIAARSL
jgi:small-conductance mechanosensitive channel